MAASASVNNPSGSTSPTNHLSKAERQFLEPYLPANEIRAVDATTAGPEQAKSPQQREQSAHKPFVTLTYAASLDAMISLAPGTRTTLSGPESKAMTHFLRSQHDAILVGVGTAAADDPGLNCRYPDVTLEAQPRPLVLDPRGRWDPSLAKVVRLAREGQGRPPWQLVGPGVGGESNAAPCCERLVVRSDGVPSEGAKMDWSHILTSLAQRGIRSVMVEGGATVINDLLAEPGLVDSVIITIAPTFLGRGGVTVAPAPKSASHGRVNAANLTDTVWKQFGADAVLCGRLGP